MCVFSRPKPPPLPKPEPKDSPIEDTADKVVIGSKRSLPGKQKKSITSTRMGRRAGTNSLRIARNPNTGTGNLNY